MNRGYTYERKPQKGLLPHEFYFTYGGGGPGNIFNSISSNGNQLESRIKSFDESRVPRQSQKIVLRKEMEYILSLINSIKCVDISDHTKIDLEATIQKRKKAYLSAPPRIMVREIDRDIIYTKHFNRSTGTVSYRTKNH